MSNYTPAIDYSAYFSLFGPLLAQQSALFQANAHQANYYASFQANVQLAQQQQQQLQLEKQRERLELARERKAQIAAGVAAAADAAAAAERAQQEEDEAYMPHAPEVAPPIDESDPPPTIDTFAPESVAIQQMIESEWRWSAVCLFFEQFLPVYSPRTLLTFKAELVMQSFMCTHHSCKEHKWDACTCPHQACTHLATCFLQLLLILYPNPNPTKKNARSLMGTHNFLSTLQSEIEKLYFMANAAEYREAIQEIMAMFIEAEEEKKAEKKRLEQERRDREAEEKGETATKQNKFKFSLPLGSPLVRLPGSAILASHFHRLPPLCKLYLLHFLCEHVLCETEELREVCTQSNALFCAGVTDPPTMPGPAEEPLRPPNNPFHQLGISVEHGCDDDGNRYWCFMQEEYGRLHLYKDRKSGAVDEWHVQMKRKNGKPPREALVHGNEHDEDEEEKSSSDDDDDEDMDDGEEPQPIDDDHAPPSFNFTLLTSDYQSVHDFVSVGLTTQKSEASLSFLKRLETDVLPACLLLQKKFERQSRRERIQQQAAARQQADLQYFQLTGETAYSSGRSQRTRKQVNYSEVAEGDIHQHDDDDDDEEHEEPKEATPYVTASGRTTRRNAAAVNPSPYVSAAIQSGSTVPAAASSSHLAPPATAAASSTSRSTSPHTTPLATPSTPTQKVPTISASSNATSAAATTAAAAAAAAAYQQQQYQQQLMFLQQQQMAAAYVQHMHHQMNAPTPATAVTSPPLVPTTTTTTPAAAPTVVTPALDAGVIPNVVYPSTQNGTPAPTITAPVTVAATPAPLTVADTEMLPALAITNEPTPTPAQS